MTVLHLHLHRTAPTPLTGDTLTGEPRTAQPSAGERPACASARPAGGAVAGSHPRGRVAAIAPGLLLALTVAAVATVVGQHVPLVGSAVPGAVIGAGIALAIRPGARLAPGLKWASTFVLQCSVVLLGAQLSIGEAARVGVSSLPVMLVTLAICLGAAWLYGRLLNIPHDLRTLVGVGTGICGGSAIAAVAPVIEAASADVAYAISTIFLFNIAAVLAFPLLGHALGMSQQSFGLFAGTAVNDTSSVVATAATYGAAASSHAVVVKLVRTLMIIPICLGLAALTARKRTAATATASPADPAATTPAPAARAARMSPKRIVKLVPWFLIGFVIAAAVNSSGVIPVGAHVPIQHVSVFLVAVALSAIGLSTDVAALRQAGHRPLLLGALLWITVAGASLGLQALTGTI
ncbi:putative sulfate exporter family transporter [Trebonia kvetii]|uniref:Putative sulfate exporter family transporter n=1 Tax=Trebonia kvetii TaxID=2480626 RepID=A0A6P2BR05_9ACTN|nr:putative sulfate exporter family transporter [Trebonia kvetii]TVZ01097.1 putative sulfate exporter family transporter [Trebonia kvetii]